MVLMQENVPIGFNYILQDYHGEIQDYKQALDSYFDAFSLLLGMYVLGSFKNMKTILV